MFQLRILKFSFWEKWVLETETFWLTGSKTTLKIIIKRINIFLDIHLLFLIFKCKIIVKSFQIDDTGITLQWTRYEDSMTEFYPRSFFFLVFLHISHFVFRAMTIVLQIAFALLFRKLNLYFCGKSHVWQKLLLL